MNSLHLFLIFFATILIFSSIGKLLAIGSPSGDVVVLRDIVISIFNLVLATALLYCRNRFIFVVSSAVLVVYTFISVVSLWHGGSCGCFDDLILSKYVVVLDIGLMLGCLWFATRSRFESARDSLDPKSTVLGGSLAVFVFLVLTHLSSQHPNFDHIDLVWDKESLLKSKWSDLVKFRDGSGLDSGASEQLVLVYDARCNRCVRHWTEMLANHSESNSNKQLTALWKQTDGSWFACRLDQPAPWQTVHPSNVVFIQGEPSLPTPTTIEVAEGRIVSIHSSS